MTEMSRLRSASLDMTGLRLYCPPTYLLFESWQHLIDFMLDDSTPVTTGNTS